MANFAFVILAAGASLGVSVVSLVVTTAIAIGMVIIVGFAVFFSRIVVLAFVFCLFQLLSLHFYLG